MFINFIFCNTNMKKLLLIFVSIFMFWLCFAQQWPSLIPTEEGWSNVWDYVSWVSVPWHVLEKQRDLIKSWNLSMSDQINSWIMSRDTILDYCVYLVKFLWEVALLAWAVAIIFLWYKRITKNVFWESPKGLVMVVIWILVVIFAYVIVKLLWSAFIS